ncbi:hypothetical protein MN608_02489 [Microdochium nivale]|nr:hypothetical protein MN608_02489 [Microdochium nivale]
MMSRPSLEMLFHGPPPTGGYVQNMKSERHKTPPHAFLIGPSQDRHGNNKINSRRNFKPTTAHIDPKY